MASLVTGKVTLLATDRAVVDMDKVCVSVCVSIVARTCGK